MANRAVVVIRLFIIGRQRLRKHRAHWIKLQGSMPSVSEGIASPGRRISWTISCYRVLVLVVWKLWRELPFFFRLRRLLCTVGFAKRKARIFSGCGPHV